MEFLVTALRCLAKLGLRPVFSGQLIESLKITREESRAPGSSFRIPAACEKPRVQYRGGAYAGTCNWFGHCDFLRSRCGTTPSAAISQSRSTRHRRPEHPALRPGQNRFDSV